MEMQQSPLYAKYIRSLGWKVEILDGTFIYIKPFWLVGGIAKIQRCIKLPDRKKLLRLLQSYGVRTLVIEPDSRVRQTDLTRWTNTMAKDMTVNKDPYIPTKTIRIPLTKSEDELFSRLSEAKRRAVRRALKAGVTTKVSEDITAMVTLKNRSAGLLGFITTTGITKLWEILPKKHKAILFAYDAKGKAVGTVLMLFCDHIGYYWIAGATRHGKKLFAPTLLVWEAIKLAKLRKMTAFDFVGVWDERIANKNTEWKGFTKFKEGFGGNELYYPLP
jgi:lipid II:glycine glycyltransferase (peptidoglycan interpeptide bridge formation enzyme)